MNPLKKQITDIAREVVLDYKLPIWGIVEEVHEATGGFTVTVRFKEPKVGNVTRIENVPVLVGGKGIQDVQLEKDDRVQILFHEGRLDDPAVVQVAPRPKKNESGILSILFGWL